MKRTKPTPKSPLTKALDALLPEDFEKAKAANKKASLSEQVKASKKEIVKQRKGVDPKSLISTGSTMLNLACSGRVEGAFQIGKIANIIGDSHTGKTLLALTIFAECANDKRFDNYKFIYDDAEFANEFDIEEIFGKKTKRRICSPATDENNQPVMSETIQDFHQYIDEHSNTKTPCIYVLDSLDSIDSEEDRKKAKEQINDRKKGKKIKGTYGMSKQKRMAWLLSHCVGSIKKNKSALFIVSQTRDKIDSIGFGSKKTRSGGRALKFYCTHEMWLAIIETLKKNKKVIGTKIKIKVSKSKITGKVREATFDIYYDYGIDDVGSMIDFMINEDIWKERSKKDPKTKKVKTYIDAFHLDLKERNRTKLIEAIEDGNLEHALKRAVQIEWDEIEESLRLDRKPKYN